MDYRYYRGDGPKIPPKLIPYLHRLRLVGTVLMACGLAMPMLILIHLLKSTYLLDILAFVLILLGPILYLIGMVFDNYVDRTK
jgi:predicted membrane channel-forming protein YqfA (hemolysin III family)